MKNADENTKISWWPVGILFAGVFFLWLFSWRIYSLIPDWLLGSFPGEMAERGQFGDTFGAINALFSGLAFAGLFYAIVLQRHELKLQKEELRDTRIELQGQKEALINQNKTFSQGNPPCN